VRRDVRSIRLPAPLGGLYAGVCYRGGVATRLELTPLSARAPIVADGVLASAGVLLGLGMLRMFLFEKDGVYYLHSGPFLTKLALFALFGLLSIGPTRRFLAMRGRCGRGGRRALRASVASGRS
jgi:uncharacterized membrane protein